VLAGVTTVVGMLWLAAMAVPARSAGAILFLALFTVTLPWSFLLGRGGAWNSQKARKPRYSLVPGMEEGKGRRWRSRGRLSLRHMKPIYHLTQVSHQLASF
jgi:uncharacterized membrane protein YdfJ with MMPL/SSD domain